MYCINRRQYSSMAYLTPNVRKIQENRMAKFSVLFFIQKRKHYKYSYQSGAGYVVKGKTLNDPDCNVISYCLSAKQHSNK